MTLPGAVIKKIIRRLLASEDYRVEIVKLIDDDFLQYVIKFFGRVVDAKLQKALDKILPLILSDDVQTSSTPDIVLRELNRDYGSQLLLDFE